MTKKFIVLNREDLEPGDLYIDPSIKVTQEPADGCVCEWKSSKHDEWLEWECSKCGARVPAEVWE